MEKERERVKETDRQIARRRVKNTMNLIIIIIFSEGGHFIQSIIEVVSQDRHIFLKQDQKPRVIRGKQSHQKQWRAGRR
jgi:hypothetical protein